MYQTPANPTVCLMASQWCDFSECQYISPSSLSCLAHLETQHQLLSYVDNVPNPKMRHSNHATLCSTDVGINEWKMLIIWLLSQLLNIWCNRTNKFKLPCWCSCMKWKTQRMNHTLVVLFSTGYIYIYIYFSYSFRSMFVLKAIYILHRMVPYLSLSSKCFVSIVNTEEKLL